MLACLNTSAGRSGIFEKKKQMTQSDLADVTGTSTKFISDVERGKNTVQIDKVFDLILALGLKVYLTTESWPPKNNDG